MRWRILVWRVVFGVYAGLIFILSSLPVGGGEPLLPIPCGDKLIHFLEFGCFSFLAWRSLPSPRRLSWSLSLTFLYAASDEFHQIFVITREASLLDWFADVAGGTAAAVLIVLFTRFSLLGIWRGRIIKGMSQRNGG